jgi:hypothetical protein
MVTITELLSRLSRTSVDVQIGQVHAIKGTPCEVPVPKKVTIMRAKLQQSLRFALFLISSLFKVAYLICLSPTFVRTDKVQF